MSVTVTICCSLCHRWRVPEKMNGTRCLDRAACLAAAGRAAPVTVSKRTLRAQYGTPEGGLR